MHGAGLSMLVFLPSHGTVLEMVVNPMVVRWCYREKRDQESPLAQSRPAKRERCQTLHPTPGMHPYTPQQACTALGYPCWSSYPRTEPSSRCFRVP